MFRQMRQTLQIQKPTDILSHIHSLPARPPPPPTPATPLNHRGTAAEAIQAIEREAMTTQTPQPGLLELMTYLERRGVRKALCTRNFRAPVKHLCETFMPGIRFDPVITREAADVPPKPSPMGIWKIAESWGLGAGGQVGARLPAKGDGPLDGTPSAISPAAAGDAEGKEDPTEHEERLLLPSSSTTQNPHADHVDPLDWARSDLGAGLIMVGDSLDDMAAGFRAGAATILLASEETEPELLQGHDYVDLVVRRLDAIIPVLEAGFEGTS